MVLRNRYENPAVPGNGLGHSLPPHVVDVIENDSAIVIFGPRTRTRSLRNQQSVFSHQTEHAPLGATLTLFCTSAFHSLIWDQKVVTSLQKLRQDGAGLPVQEFEALAPYEAMHNANLHFL
jgi:hypothetical protein